VSRTHRAFGTASSRIHAWTSASRSTALNSFSLCLHVLAVFWLGIMAGFFGTYSANVTQALLHVDGSVYAVVQGELNRAVRHALFFAFFFPPPAWCVGSVAAGWRMRGLWSWLLLVAAVLYLAGVIVLTRQVNLPLNSYTESWRTSALPPDWAATRDAWNAANLWRTASASVAFALAITAITIRPRRSMHSVR
jgi:uncharacterized membrane protein